MLILKTQKTLQIAFSRDLSSKFLGGGYAPEPPSNSRLPQLAVWSDYGTVYINLSYWRRDRHFTWSSEPRKSLTICRAKAIPSILSYC